MFVTFLTRIWSLDSSPLPCSDYEVGQNVHYTSGYLNKAYVNAVRRCNEVCGTTAECAVLMADTFMYTNIATLSMSSNFLDAAEQTCREVVHYFHAHMPDTSCSIDDMKESVVTGFRAVGVEMSAADCHPHVACQPMSVWEGTCAAIKNFFDLGVGILGNIVGW